MEFIVGLDGGFHVARGAVEGIEGFDDAAQVRSAAAFRRQPTGLDLKPRAQFHDVQRPARVRGGFDHEIDGLFAVFGDEDADARLADQAAAQAHGGHGFADDGAADVELVAQGVFGGQFVARAVQAGVQALGQFFDDDVGQARAGGPGGSLHCLSYREIAACAGGQPAHAAASVRGCACLIRRLRVSGPDGIACKNAGSLGNP
ncbi:hypothetical protein D3C71_1517210 [compost metagenome]